MLRKLIKLGPRTFGNKTIMIDSITLLLACYPVVYVNLVGFCEIFG